jgi:monoamine oxidase
MRRTLLAGAVAVAMGACGRAPAHEAPATWLGASFARGHRLHTDRPAFDFAGAGAPRRVDVLIVGAGVAGLAAARALARRGVDDVHLIELEDTPGGNSRGHHIDAQPCPLGAHYLPLPGRDAVEVAEWLHEIGLLRSEMGRTLADERHLCHSPQERLFVDGAWHDGLLPPGAAATLAQYRRFETALEAARRAAGFTLPTERAGWSAVHDALDHVRFVDWLAAQGLHDERLRWYLDYACRDDYGAGIETVSAWAGLHYFASRHGFHAPGSANATAEREAVFTWPQGNAWLVERLAAPFAAERLHLARTVLRVQSDGARRVELWCHDELRNRVEHWQARAVVLAVPLFVAARLLASPPPALAAAAAMQPHAPWLVANVALGEPLLDRPFGAPPAWDNVRFASASLGYVDARHQGLQPVAGPTVLTSYWPLPARERPALLAETSPSGWARRVIDDLAVAHPDLPAKVRRVDLMRYGHAMSIPAPGVRSHAALRALAAQRGRVVFAHADLAGYSVFEEAFTHGTRAGATLTL